MNSKMDRRVLSKRIVTRDLVVGSAVALCVSLLGWLDIATAPTQDAADASIREFGTLLTVVFGLAAAVWWGQSTKVSNAIVEENTPAQRSQRGDANTLNGAAATCTAAGLLCSVFAGASWRSTGSWLSAITLLLLLLMSGSDLRQAVLISLRLPPEPREIAGAILLVVAAGAFLWHLVT
jgi:uncharacterized membrane protein YbjE (DUF340 family)